MNKLGLAIFFMPISLMAEEYSFDISSYEKPVYEITGYTELFFTHSELNSDSGFYNLLTASTDPVTHNNLYSAEIQLDGIYRFTTSQVNFKYSAQSQNSDILGNQNDSLFYELYYTDNHLKNVSIDVGKRVQKWGKGYAWNPVGFIERKKDPNDPELSREGYFMLMADYIQSYSQNLKTLSIMPVVLPVTDEINSDFSQVEDTNYAGKIYLLYRDIDIDIMFLTKGSRAASLGFDFSANLSANFEIHGELAYIKDKTINQLDTLNQLTSIEKNITQSLIGFRYLTEGETTWIGEYYHNGGGYNEKQLEAFFKLISSDFQTSPQLLTLSQQANSSDYGGTNPGKDYLYLSAVKKEPYELVYFNFGINSILNLQDHSYSITPEFIYTGFSNTEMRFRTSFLQGDMYSEFGEKLNDWKLEFRFRYYF